MKRILFVGAALLALTATAQAADPYSSYYGNTVTFAGADGSKVTVFVNQDMTWERHMPDGSTARGTYVWKDASTACFTQSDPAPKSPDQGTACFPNQTAHNVGDSWSVPGGDGKAITVSVMAGR